MSILSNNLFKKLLVYTCFGLFLLVLAFFTYRHEEEKNEHLPFRNEILNQKDPSLTGFYFLT